MANTEHNCDIVRDIEAIERNVARVAARDHEFPVTSLDGPPHQGVPLEHLKTVDQDPAGMACRNQVGFEQEIRQSIDVPNGRRRKDKPGHDSGLAACRT